MNYHMYYHMFYILISVFIGNSKFCESESFEGKLVGFILYKLS